MVQVVVVPLALEVLEEPEGPGRLFGSAIILL